MDHKDLMEELQEPAEAAEPEVIPEPTEEPIEEPTEEPVLHPADIQPQKKNNNAAVIVVTLLFILVIGLCVFIAVSLSDVLSKTEKKADAEYESETGNPWEEILGDDFVNKESEEEVAEPETEIPDDFEYEFEEPETDETDPLAPYLSEIQLDDYPNHERESFEGPYYPEIVNSMDESVSYKIDRVNSIYKNPMYNVLFKNSYVELSGDIPNLEEINRTIREDVMSLEENYKSGGDNLNTMLYENNFSLYGESVAYVTYNSEDWISIVVKKDIELGYKTTDAVVYCYNIDVETGEIIKNSSILKLDDDFAKEFRERSERQNGVSESTEAYTDEQILAMMRDDRSLIVFYTPLGLEVGYNHGLGWITITMQDYEKYIALP